MISLLFYSWKEKLLAVDLYKTTPLTPQGKVPDSDNTIFRLASIKNRLAKTIPGNPQVKSFWRSCTISNQELFPKRKKKINWNSRKNPASARKWRLLFSMCVCVYVCVRVCVSCSVGSLCRQWPLTAAWALPPEPRQSLSSFPKQSNHGPNYRQTIPMDCRWIWLFHFCCGQPLD